MKIQQIFQLIYLVTDLSGLVTAINSSGLSITASLSDNVITLGY